MGQAIAGDRTWESAPVREACTLGLLAVPARAPADMSAAPAVTLRPAPRADAGAGSPGSHVRMMLCLVCVLHGSPDLEAQTLISALM